MPEPIEITKIKENYNNREYVLKAVKEQGALLDFADESFKDDREIVLAAIEKPKEKIKQNIGVIFKQNFNLILSIQKAGKSSLLMAAYISFFSAVIGILEAILKSSLLTAILSTIFEVGSYTNLIANEASFSHTMRLSLIAFSLGFSGMSVHFQAFTFLPGEVSRTKYLIRKLIIGIISSLIFSVIFHLYKKNGCF